LRVTGSAGVSEFFMGSLLMKISFVVVLGAVVANLIRMHLAIKN